MIIEYSNSLFYDIYRTYCDLYVDEVDFDKWLQLFGGSLNTSNRSFYASPYKFHMEDYIEFNSERDYLMFAMKYL